MSTYVKKAIYDPLTGEVSHLWTYPSDEAAELHFLRSRSKKQNEVMADITEEEYFAFQELGEDGKITNLIDVKKIKPKLEQREKEMFEVSEFGVTYQDVRPIKAVISKSALEADKLKEIK